MDLDLSRIQNHTLWYLFKGHFVLLSICLYRFMECQNKIRIIFSVKRQFSFAKFSAIYSYQGVENLHHTWIHPPLIVNYTE